MQGSFVREEGYEHRLNSVYLTNIVMLSPFDGVLRITDAHVSHHTPTRSFLGFVGRKALFKTKDRNVCSVAVVSSPIRPHDQSRRGCVAIGETTKAIDR